MKLIIEMESKELTQENLSLIGQLVGLKDMEVPEVNEEAGPAEKPEEKTEAPADEEKLELPKRKRRNKSTEEAKSEEEKPVTLNEIKILGKEIFDSGKPEELAEILNQYGGQFATIPEDKYSECMKKLEELKAKAED